MIDFSPLDHFVRRTRLDAMTRWSASPHRLRWWPLLPIGLCLLGLAVLATATSPLAKGLAISPLCMAPGISAAIRLWGPIRAAPPDQPLDEREQLLRLRANAIGYGMVAYLAMAATLWMMIAQVFPLPKPATLQEWLAVMLTTQTLIFTLPVLVASWLLNAPLEEED
jgi:hypothetical protein